MRRNLAITAAVLALLPLGTREAEPASCTAPRSASTAETAAPEHNWSPLEAVKNSDNVFYGEVAVPSRRCSLGYCAGLRVLRRVKGDTGPTALLQIASPHETPCGTTLFRTKGEKWVVFANIGTSRTGFAYMQVSEEGPSFAAEAMPNFDQLEVRYQVLRAQLDQAIAERLQRLR